MFLVLDTPGNISAKSRHVGFDIHFYNNTLPKSYFDTAKFSFKKMFSHLQGELFDGTHDIICANRVL